MMEVAPGEGDHPGRPPAGRGDPGRTESLPDFLATRVPPGTAPPPSLREAVGAEKPGDGLADPPGTGLHIIINNHAQAIHTV